MEWLQVFGVLGFLLVCRGTPSTPSPVQNPSYLISISKVLRCGVPTTLSVTILTEYPINVTSELIHGNNSVAQMQRTILAGSTRQMVLPPVFYSEMSYLYPYQLNVQGFVGASQVFYNSTMMVFSPKCMSIFIQTDKSNYKPGQVVKIRVVSVTPDGKPYNGKIDIFIRDPRGNAIRQWDSAEGVLGVVSKELNLSQNPPLGQWKIVAGINDVVQERQFNVNYYVLPKFEVKLDFPSVLHYEDTLMGTVTAKYLYGKPISGKMNISYVHGFHGLDMHYEQEESINGSADVTFYLANLNKRSVDYQYLYDGYSAGEYIDITVNVTERVTGLTYNSSMRVTIVKNKYNLEFQQHPQTIKPSMTFTAQLKLSTYDDRPLTTEDKSRSVRLVVTQHKFSPWTWRWNEHGSLEPRMLNTTTTSSFFTPIYNVPVKEMELPVTADGVMIFQVHLSKDVATLDIEAQFEDSVKRLQLYSGYSSPSKSYIQLHRDSEPQVGEPLYLTVESNVHLSKFHYIVMSRGQVVDAGTLDSLSFSLSTDHSWTPSACVLVYYTLPDGEIVNDALQVTFTQVLRNTVSLSWSQDRAEPADSVSLSVSVSEPGSLVGILVVDKGTLDSKTDNGITETTVLEEFMAYSSEVTQTDYSGMKMGDPYSIFMNCGVTVLTDARLNLETSKLIPAFPGEELFQTQHADGMFEEPQERKHFPETWIWMDANMSDSTSASFPFTVPDSMTSWMAFGIVMSENLGLGISAPVELTVFKEFFLSLNLPPFLIRGELLLLEVYLFNYMDVDLEVLVVVAESEMFEFVAADDEEIFLAHVRKVSVLSQDVTSILFPIRATVLGEIPITVKATSIYSSDLVYQTLLVKPEGMEQLFTQTLFLEFLHEEKALSRSMEFSFPADVVPGSQRAHVSAVGDILGPSMGNLDSLIQMPYGCGEQNMIHFAPNIYVLQYLRSTGQVEEQTGSRAMSYMMEAYECELSYQRLDGSFSAFGDSDYSGSTWLSAFVLRCFLQARTFISIEPTLVQRTAAWLVTQQEPDGSFREPGHVIHTELQGGLDGPVSLTAYVLIALLEDDDYRSTYEGSVSSALSFMTSRLAQGISSNYSLCLVTYALSLANSSAAPSALKELMNRALIRDGVPFWNSLLDSWPPRSADIEMSAYVLLSMHRQAQIYDGFSLMKWLSQQRNHLGGYGSTQDTVVALQALSVYATYSSSEYMDLTITVNNPTGTMAIFSISRSNYLLHQSQDLPMEAENPVHIQVVAEGKGFALFQLSVFYYANSQRTSLRRRDVYTDDAFYLYVDMLDNDTFRVNLHICFSLREDQGLYQTGMAILDVGLITGFSLAQDTIHTDDVVRRIETPPGRAILYLNTVTTSERCVEIPTFLDFKVASVQNAVVVIYDYYEPRRKTMRSYTSEKRRDMSVCSLCGSDCSQCGAQYIHDVYHDGTPSFNQHHLLTLGITTALLILLSIYN
ncbi:CD109 antigen-like [Xyrauchen texanus]|uniref:CD109 antigen-like n=1 Tax=Xyrauchen texanus TaxID=154827 RepID=UPI0022427BCE|nr:CD109 antigen-like [Xyrauchen texanus]